MAYFRILFASVCIFTLLDLGLAVSVSVKRSNMNNELAESAKSIVKAAYNNYYDTLELKVKYVAHQMNGIYDKCKWNIVANADEYEISSDYWILVSATHRLIISNDFLIFSAQCDGKY
ncbi:hypothetical protein Trydic_g6743 [Trypoxylus dichotomus]